VITLQNLPVIAANTHDVSNTAPLLNFPIFVWPMLTTLTSSRITRQYSVSLYSPRGNKLQLPCLLQLLINKTSTTARINSCQMWIGVLSIPPTINAQHTNSWNSRKSQFVYRGTLHSTKTLRNILLRNVRVFVCFKTVTPHFRTILKTCIYNETNRLPTATAVPHSISVSFLPRVSEKPVAAKKKGIAPTGTIS
jgi:hypothetical protein